METQKELREKVKEAMQNENRPIGSRAWLIRQEGVEDDLVNLLEKQNDKKGGNNGV